MISLELAKRLKDAGLWWEPKIGDCAIGPFDGDLIHKDLLGEIWELSPKERDEFDEKSTWLPNLSQLLGEIEGRGYFWDFKYRNIKGVRNNFDTLEGGATEIRPSYNIVLYQLLEGEELVYMYAHDEEADTPEEAAGMALLWVLERSVIE